jgi:hypothetical protein
MKTKMKFVKKVRIERVLMKIAQDLILRSNLKRLMLDLTSISELLAE